MNFLRLGFVFLLHKHFGNPLKLSIEGFQKQHYMSLKHNCNRFEFPQEEINKSGQTSKNV